MKIRLLVLFICCKTTLGEPFDSQPRIHVNDGNIIFESPPNKNITFKSERGFISVNGHNLLASAQNTHNLENSWSPGTGSNFGAVDNLQNDIRSLKDSVKKIEDTYQKLTDLASRYKEVFGRVTPEKLYKTYRDVNKIKKALAKITEILKRNECYPNPCNNGATCIDGYNGFQCQCSGGWDGTICDQDVNECALFVGTELGCQNGATCKNLRGSYKCECPPNWYGQHCTEQHDECSLASNEALCGHGTCIPRTSSNGLKYMCLCDQGWKKDGSSQACNVDIDECATGTHHCSGECINEIGGFRCGCSRGYEKIGNDCVDRDECQANNGGCSPLVQCENLPGSFRCGRCPVGYSGDGKICSFVGICGVDNGGCHSEARCVESGGDYRQCICPPGYEGDGIGPAGCVVSSSSRSCNPNPCNHGQCQLTLNKRVCICEAGWRGELCNKHENPCMTNVCKNGGTCRPTDAGQFICQCPVGYQGTTCENQVESCGGSYRTSNGTITYPIYGNTPFSGARRCIWIITVPRNKVITLTFTQFNLELSDDCYADNLQIFDGPTESDPVLGRFCGGLENIPNNATIVSNRYKLLIRLRSTSIDHGDGFELTWQMTDPRCGGIVTDDHGSITSPNYPNNYPAGRDCFWKFNLTRTKRIQFHFALLALEDHDRCEFDWLRIYDGPSQEDPLLATFCNTSSPPPLITAGSSALVHFHSDLTANDRGFHITYSTIPGTPGCGGLFTEKMGYISSPNYPSQYTQNLECEYIIRSSNERIELTFIEIDLEHNRNCKHDYVEVRDGSEPDSPLIGRYCSELAKPKDKISASSNKLFIKFRSDWSKQGKGFKAHYKTFCGAVFSDESGIIKSPNYPQSYPDHKTCLYQIRLPPGKVIRLQFLAFDIEDGSGCQYDYLRITEPGFTNSSFRDRLCGRQPPDPITTSMNELDIEFKTDGSNQNRGFLLNYTSVDVACGGVHRERHGIITSPNHPNNYVSMSACNYLLIAPLGFRVQLTFSLFRLEPSRSCRYDSVEILERDQVLGKFCGDTKPDPLMSMSNQLLVKFNSDGNNEFEGFVASYSFLNGSKYCGGSIKGESGEIHSPNFPDRYPPNRKCIWKIFAPENRRIRLKFIKFSLEPHPKCLLDYLAVFNGRDSHSPLLGMFCGANNPGEIISHSNLLYLEFRTDQSISNTGFTIMWDTALAGCGGTITSSTGTIVSPNYPFPYNHNAECTWLVRVAKGSRVRAVFADIEMELQPQCSLDFVEVFDGPDRRSPRLAKVCHANHLSGEIVSSKNLMTIKMRSDQSVAKKGFKLNYWTQCNTNLTGIYGVIETPNYPSPFPPQCNCSWTIVAPRGNNISLTFAQFHLVNNDCKRNYVFINGTNQRYKLCGVNPLNGSQLVWPENIIRINFVSDYGLASITDKGFRLEWRAIGCGKILFEADEGTITSPNYPNSYPHNLDCVYHVKVRDGYQVVAEIKELDLEPDVNCRFDYLKVFAGPDTTSPSLASAICGHSATRRLTSMGNQLTILFHSDSSRSHKGFKMRYFSRAGTCGGDIIAESGTIISPNYPGNYDPIDDCTWVLSTFLQRFRRYSVKVEELFIPSKNPNCTQSYLSFSEPSNALAFASLAEKRATIRRLWNGFSNRQIATLCGTNPPSEMIVSSKSNLEIRLKGDGHVAGKFKLSFKMICGGEVAVSSLIYLKSRNFPRFSTEDKCNWTLRATEPGKKLLFQFTYLLSNPNKDCLDSYVELRDGDSPTSPFIGRYCGTSIPPIKISEGSALYVYAHDGPVFSARVAVESSQCGSILYALNGQFISPGYPKGYPVDTECIWTINVSPGNRIALSFDDFRMEESDLCAFDYLEIREESDDGNFIGKFCGSNKPQLNQTSFTKLWIKLRTDPEGTAPGFAISWSLLNDVEISGESGLITSPGYPNYMYSNQSEFRYRIVGPENQIIRLKFINIDIPTGFKICKNYVQIRDGLDSSASLLGTYCGHSVEEVIQTTSNTVFVVFESAYNTRFELEWRAGQQNTTDGPYDIDAAKSRCYEFLTIPMGRNVTILSPGYPFGYENNLNCTWVVISPKGMHNVFTIEDINLEGFDYCTYDNVTFYQFNYQEWRWQINRTVCSKALAKFEIPGRFTKMVFATDLFQNKTGFNMTVSSKCGATMIAKEYSNIIDSTMLANDTECQWTLVAKEPGHKIRIRFTRFYVGSPSGSCSSAFMSIRNGFSSNSPPLGAGTFCGNSIPPLLESSSNYVHISIKAPHESPADFSLDFARVSIRCGNEIRITPDSGPIKIRSPNFPSPPPHTLECEWLITGPSDKTLRFDLAISETSSDCNINKTVVRVHDGGTRLAPLLRQFCPRSRDPGIETSENILYVYFMALSDLEKAVFEATVEVNDCGGSFHVHYRRYLTSPNFPNSYESNLFCKYTFFSRNMSDVLLIHIFTLDLPSDDIAECNSGDYIEFRRASPNGDLISKYCGTINETIKLDSGSDVVYMNFRSDSERNGKGFKILVTNYFDRCSRRIEASELTGEISSPRFTLGHPAPRTCEWLITGQPDQHVELKFTAYNLKNDVRNPNKCLDSLAINLIPPFWRRRYEKEYDSNSLLMPCNGTIPTKIVSTTSYLKIRFVTGGLAPGEGFKATFVKVPSIECGGLVTVQRPNFESANFSLPTNGELIYCSWRVQFPRTGTNAIVYKTVQIMGSEKDENKCDNFYIKESSMLGISSFTTDQTEFEKLFTLLLAKKFVPTQTICGNMTDFMSIQKSWSNLLDSDTLDVIAKINRTNGYRGLQATIKNFECGGYFFESSMNISSPEYPSNYPADMICIWVLQDRIDATWTITFADFQLEDNCEVDYVEIQMGHTEKSVARYCGSLVPPLLTVNSYSATIIFRADSRGSARGFQLSAEAIRVGCGGRIIRSFITTPGYPFRSYSKNLECVWTLDLDTGYHARLLFEGRFDIEQSKNCSNDFLEIQELKNDQWTHGKRFCGNIKPESFDLSSQKARIIFRSDSNNALGDGFKLKIIRICGGLINGGSGMIHSPEFDSDAAAQCEWTLQGNLSDYIMIKFETFDMTESPSCRYDRLIIFQGNNSSDQTKASRAYCGSNTPDPMETRGSAIVQFSKDYLSRPQFSFSYKIVSCGGVFNATRGAISSPNSEGRYLANMDCIYTIIVPKNMLVKVRFTRFSLVDIGCSAEDRFFSPSLTNYDFLDVFDGKMAGFKLTAQSERICGGQPPPNITSSTNILTLRFSSDERLESSGFYATFHAVPGPFHGCGGILNATQGTIVSPDVDNDGKYEPDIDCVWLIIGGQDKLIKLSFDKIDVGTPPKTSSTVSNFTMKCDSGFLEIRDGISADSPLIDIICGQTLPTFLTSSSRYMYIGFHSDLNVLASGFKLKYEALEPVCGGFFSIDNETITITSPEYPGPYPPSVRCKWVIHSVRYLVPLELHFSDFDIDCDHNDVLEIVGNSVFEETHKLCGYSYPPTIHSRLLDSYELTFVSGPEQGFHHGFSATIKPMVCNQTFTEDSGVIYSIGYPSVYHESSERYCVFNISVAVGNSISVFFHTFELESSEKQNSCSSLDNLEVKGSQSTDITTLTPDLAPSLNEASTYSYGKYCGKALPSPIFSSTNFLTFILRSSSNYRYVLIYSSTSAGPGCGGNITALNGTFTSPFYPNPYKENKECVWSIKNLGYHTMTLRFTQFAFTSSVGCESNFVEIYDGPEIKDDTLVSRYCGKDTPAPHTSSSNVVTVRMKTNTLNNELGFRAVFKTNKIDLRSPSENRLVFGKFSHFATRNHWAELNSRFRYLEK